MKTHINDVAAYSQGHRFAVMDNGGDCVAYFSDLNSANQAASRIRGRVVHLTGSKNPDTLQLERNGISSDAYAKETKVRKNPIKDFVFPDSYTPPHGTIEKIKESMTPGVREIPALKGSPVLPETEYPVPDVEIPAPTGSTGYLPHQIAGITSMIRKKNILLADEQGLGKTIEVIGYINALDPDKTLIVAPGIAVPNWIDELNKWLVDKSKRILVLWNKKFCTIKVIPGKYADTYEYIPVEDQVNPKWDIIVTRYNEFSGKKTDAEKAAAGGEVGERKLTKKEREALGIPKPKRGSGSEKDESNVVRISSQVRKTLKVFEKGLDLLVLDECHTVKNVKAIKTIALFGEKINPDDLEDTPYPGLASFATRKIFASGTPVVNDKPIELFHLLKSLDKKNWLNLETFKEWFGGGKQGASAKNNDMLGIKMRDTVLVRRLADDVLELPPPAPITMEIEDTPEVQTAKAIMAIVLGAKNPQELKAKMDEILNSKKNNISIDEAEEKGIDEADSEDSEDDISEINKILHSKLSAEDKARYAAQLKLQHAGKEEEIASGRQKIPLTVIQLARVAMAEAKALQFKDIFKRVTQQCGQYMKNGKLVIFYVYKVAGDIIEKQLLELGYKADQIVRIDKDTPNKNGYRGYLVKKFQKDPNVKIFLGTIETCSSAITLTAANVTIFMDLDWRPGIVAQAERRTLRWAADNKDVKAVYWFYPFAPDSIDANVYSRLDEKRKIQRRILDRPPGVIFPGDLVEGKQKYTGITPFYRPDLARKAIVNYENNFRVNELPGAKYPADQRLLIKKAAQALYDRIYGTKKEPSVYRDRYGYIDFDKVGISEEEWNYLSRLVHEINNKNSYKYHQMEPITTIMFPEELIDDALPMIWKKRNLIPQRAIWNDLHVPDEITGIIRGLFRPIRSGGYDEKVTDSFNPLHAYLFAITRPIRVLQMEELQKKKKERKEAEIEEMVEAMDDEIEDTDFEDED